MSKVHDTAPKAIYLCLGDEDEVLDELFPDLAESGEITWSEDQSTTHVVRYVRADSVEAMQASIDTFCAGHDWAADEWKQQPTVSGLYRLRSRKARGPDDE